MNSSIATESVVSEVLRRKPLHRRFLRNSIAQLSQEELNEVDRYIQFMENEGLSIDQLASAYLLIVDDTFREEIRFKQTGSYRFSTFAEAKETVYDNPAYMKEYMIGLALSSFWWLNHVLMRRFFKMQLPALAAAGTSYREVGPGHGMYFLEALRSGLFGACEGVDISETSIALTRRVVDSGFFGSFQPARLLQSDFLLGGRMELADVLVMGEVLEHVENPAAFLKRAHETTSADCRFFLTTCINAPAIDHLYNPGSVAALEALFAAQDFAVVERALYGRADYSIETCEKERLAVNVAYVLRKAKKEND